ncbi:MAG TPA: Rieske 2Fe-2S domain-containing protein [Candidatus Dormibacteraeota bacterium]|nr:Rieske 2Fe-2S domain-containing protein [Candidatus Dormibacteraeota bacterium]
MTATVVTGLLPVLVYFWPAPPKGQKKAPITVGLDTPIDQLQDNSATKILAPTSPNSAFVMADGGGDNAKGDLAFGAFVVKTGGNVQVFAQNCSHLGCSINFNDNAKTFDCPCHGSRFHLDGTVLHGPAQNPLSHLTWKQGDSPNSIQVDGIVLGF